MTHRGAAIASPCCTAGDLPAYATSWTRAWPGSHACGAGRPSPASPSSGAGSTYRPCRLPGTGAAPTVGRKASRLRLRSAGGSNRVSNLAQANGQPWRSGPPAAASPLHARRKRKIVEMFGVVYPLTSACAEKTSSTGGSPTSALRLPPHARRKQGLEVVVVEGRPLTPVCTGKTSTSSRFGRASPAHPRMREENFTRIS